MRYIISLGGSLIVPDNIDVEYLKKFKEFIESSVNDGHSFIIVTGGGRPAREYQQALKNFNDNDHDLDLVGIKATKLNGELVKNMFKNSYNQLIEDPYKEIPDEKIVIATGYKPGCSTDMDAMIIAVENNIDIVINLTNTDYVYDKDPSIEGAKALKDISWDEFFEIVGDEWRPGMNAPFDPIAARKAKEHGKKVMIINGKDFENLNNALKDKEFIGTSIQ